MWWYIRIFMLNWHYVFDTFKFFKLFPFGVRIFVLILAYPGQKFKYDNGAVWGLLQNKRNLINKRKKLGGRGPFQTFLGSFRTRIRIDSDSGFSAAGVDGLARLPRCLVGHSAQSRIVWDSPDGTISMRISIGRVCWLKVRGPHMQNPVGPAFLLLCPSANADFWAHNR